MEQQATAGHGSLTAAKDANLPRCGSLFALRGFRDRLKRLEAENSMLRSALSPG
jgi:hypothetical protein